MSIFDCFPKKEELVKKTCEIDISLYEKLEHLSKNVYDASINKLINVCLENLFQTKDVALYSRPQNEITVMRSIYLRKSICKKLEKFHLEYNLSYNRLINIAVRNALIKENLIKFKK